ncbi:hypothetical protein [Streptomyces hypolithicus]
MLVGLVVAFGATLCFGLASVLQAHGAREAPREDRVTLRLLTRLARSPLFVLGAGLDVVGFVCSIVALRSLPLFVVQAVTNASLAVTAVGAVWLLGVRARPRDGVVVVTVVAGLGLLAVGSGEQGHTPPAPLFRVVLLATPVVALLLTAVLARSKGDWTAVALGLLSGVGFGVTSLAVRIMNATDIAAVLTDPATYALVIGGIGGYVSYALAVQRGSVTAATAAGTVAEVLGPGLVGVLMLGDQVRAGMGWLALTGVILAVGGTLALSRFGEVGPEPPRSPSAGPG